MKYIKDVFDSEKGKNLFIMFVPCNFEYLILMHDMLNYVKMRKLILTVVDDDKVDELSKGIEEIAMSEEKENDDPNMTRAESNTSTVKKERRSLNIERLKKIENKTGVEKSTILDLASKLQDGNMKNEEALRDVIKQISSITGKNVSVSFPKAI